MTLKHLVAGGILCAATMAALPPSRCRSTTSRRRRLPISSRCIGSADAYRCWWRPNYYSYGPRFYAAPRVCGAAVSLSRLPPLVMPI